MSKKARVKTKKVINNDTLYNELSTFNYQPLSTITCGDFKYVKVVNKLGQKCYILIDDDTTDFVGDLILNKSDTSLLSYSLKNGAIKTSSLDTYGVMCECEKGLCFLNYQLNDNNVTVNETNYILTNDRVSDHITYPVIRLSEVRVNNDLVVDGVNIVTKQLRNNAYNDQYNNLTATLSSVDNLNNSFIDLIELINDQIYKNIDDVYKKNEYINHLICTLERVNLFKKQIDNINDEVNNYINHLEQV